MSIAAEDIRSIKKAVCDAVAAVSGIGEVIPSRMIFRDKAEYWAAVGARSKQKDIERDGIACAMVYLVSPSRKTDPNNEQIFEMDFGVQLFREGFPQRVDETSSPDVFRKKLIASEDAFDAAAVNLGRALSGETAVSGLSADVKATILPIDTTDGEIAYGPPDFLPSVEGHHLTLTLRVEVIYDDC